MEKFSIFIIGPMGNELAHHTAAIKVGVEKALARLAFPAFEVTIPDSLGGSNIVQDVFHKIDSADLAIADISNRSPNVFYEIALFDTLGTPTIMLEEKSDARNQPPVPFYWRQSRVHQIAKFSPGQIAKKLESVFKNFQSGPDPLNLAANPITQFYDVPLVDVSAASGLAVGYYDNFLRHMLMEKQGVLALPENKLKKLIVVRPLRIEGFQQDDDDVQQLFPNAIKFTAKAPTQRRGEVVLPRVQDGVVIDLPTAIYSMVQAPRFKTLRKRLSNFQNINPQLSDQILEKLEGKMISAFFKTVDFLLRFDQGMSRHKLEIETVASLREKHE
jgi:hypothetical protein